MAAAPIVSICIPAYRQTEFLRRTLQSILVQNETRWELIISDDSPDDEIEKLLKEFNFGDKLNYFRNKKSLGSPANWNEAIRHAKAPYVKLMHHDDWFSDSESLGKYIQLMEENPKAIIGFSATTIFNAKNNSTCLHSATKEQLEKLSQDPRILFYGNFIGAPSAVIVRKENGLVYDEKIKYVVDIDFYIRSLQKNPNFAFTKEPLITNVSDSEHQVTQQSQDAKTQLTEYIYLYNKMWKGKMPSKEARLFFRHLFLKYKIRTVSQLKKLGTPLPKPAFVFAAILFYLRMKGRHSHD
jgi:glycosyltransferase involved in cell wall biosynthesis